MCRRSWGRSSPRTEDVAGLSSTARVRLAAWQRCCRRADRASEQPLVAEARPLVLSGHSRLLETAGNLGIAVRDEAAFVTRGESAVATDGEVDLLGFSDEKTVPVMK